MNNNVLATQSISQKITTKIVIFLLKIYLIVFTFLCKRGIIDELSGKSKFWCV